MLNDKIYNMKIKVNGELRKLSVIAESEPAALVETMKLLEISGLDAEEIKVDSF